MGIQSHSPLSVATGRRKIRCEGNAGSGALSPMLDGCTGSHLASSRQGSLQRSVSSPAWIVSPFSSCLYVVPISLPTFLRFPRIRLTILRLNHHATPCAESGCVHLQRHRRRGRERIRGRIIRPAVSAIIRPAARIRVGVGASLILRVFVPASTVRDAGRRG